MSNISESRKILRQMTRKVISFFPAFAEISGNCKAGLFLSQAFYWTEGNHNDRDEGWFYKTSKEWTEETFLTRHEQDSCREILESKGFLAQKLKGHPPKCFYKVMVDAVLEAVSNLPESGKSICRKSAGYLPESGNLSSILDYTKNTAEIAPVGAAPEIGALCHTCGAYGVHHCKYPGKSRKPKPYTPRERHKYVEEKPARKTAADRGREAAENCRILFEPERMAPGLRRILSTGRPKRDGNSTVSGGT